LFHGHYSILNADLTVMFVVAHIDSFVQKCDFDIFNFQRVLLAGLVCCVTD